MRAQAAICALPHWEKGVLSARIKCEQQVEGSAMKHPTNREPAGVVIDPTNGGPIDFSDPANCGLIAY